MSDIELPITSANLRNLNGVLTDKISTLVDSFMYTVENRINILARRGKTNATFSIDALHTNFINDNGGKSTYYIADEDEMEFLHDSFLDSLKENYLDCKITYTPGSVTLNWEESLPNGNCGGCISETGCDCISGRD